MLDEKFQLNHVYKTVDLTYIRCLEVLSVGCPTHKSYRAIHKPRIDCPMCNLMWEAQQIIKEMPNEWKGYY